MAVPSGSSKSDVTSSSRPGAVMSGTSIAQALGHTLSRTRRTGAATGIVLLLALGIVPEGTLSDRLAAAAFATLAFATAAGWVQLLLDVRLRRAPRVEAPPSSPLAWLVVTIATAVATSVAVQTWFRPGTSIAGG